MRNYKIKTKVINNFNDSKNAGKSYEKNDEIVLDRARYEELLSKGFVAEGKILEEKPKVSYEKEEE